MARRNTLIEAEKVEINQLMYRPAVEHPQYLRQCQSGRNRAYEWFQSTNHSPSVFLLPQIEKGDNLNQLGPKKRLNWSWI
jgi:hypothetical protein